MLPLLHILPVFQNYFLTVHIKTLTKQTEIAREPHTHAHTQTIKMANKLSLQVAHYCLSHPMKLSFRHLPHYKLMQTFMGIKQT